MSFAEKLKAERLRLGLTQPQAAEVLWLSNRVYWDYENAKSLPEEITQEGALARLAKIKSKAEP